MAFSRMTAVGSNAHQTRSLFLVALLGSWRSTFSLLLALLDDLGLSRSRGRHFLSRSRFRHFLDVRNVGYGRLFLGDEVQLAAVRQVLHAQHLAEAQGRHVHRDRR